MNRTEERVFDMKQKIAIILAAVLCVGMLSGCDSIFGTTSKSAQSGQNMSSAVTASAGTVSSGEVSSEPVSSAPPAPVGDVTDTVAGGHYNNNTPAYYSQYVLVCGDYALEIFSSARILQQNTPSSMFPVPLFRKAPRSIFPPAFQI